MTDSMTVRLGQSFWETSDSLTLSIEPQLDLWRAWPSRVNPTDGIANQLALQLDEELE